MFHKQRLIVFLGLSVCLTSCLSLDVSYTSMSKPYTSEKLSYADIKVISQTDTSVCFQRINEVSNSSVEGCTMGCYQCTDGCRSLYGMDWSCCEGFTCCCYTIQCKCAQPNVTCTRNYC